jgi:hypothetical protein
VLERGGGETYPIRIELERNGKPRRKYLSKRFSRKIERNKRKRNMTVINSPAAGRRRPHLSFSFSLFFHHLFLSTVSRIPVDG